MPPGSTDITLTPSQQAALEHLLDFLKTDGAGAFILTGFAGTGKTSLVRILADRMAQSGRYIFSFHASTGRAAKVLHDISGSPASTVHSLIYTFKGINQDVDTLFKTDSEGNAVKIEADGQLVLNFGLATLDNNTQEKAYIIDEASMISNHFESNSTQATFGSGKLLEDLFSYDRSGKFIFIGDRYQLPPIGEDFSPALSEQFISSTFNIRTASADLTDIVRQSADNDLILAANIIRLMHDNPPPYTWVKFPLKRYEHIIIHPSVPDMLQDYVEHIKECGYSSCIMISNSNRRCKVLSHTVRTALGFNKHTLCIGDLLLVVQNNQNGLLNGNLVKVTQIGARTERAELTFLNVEVEETFSKERHTTLLIENILFSQYLNLTQEQYKRLFIDFHIRMKEKGIKQNSDTYIKAMREDSYLNALRTTFGYVVTCHKAQGGEWDDVYLDIGRAISHCPSKSDYQWLYTALTRAKERIHLANDFYLM